MVIHPFFSCTSDLLLYLPPHVSLLSAYGKFLPSFAIISVILLPYMLQRDRIHWITTCWNCKHTLCITVHSPLRDSCWWPFIAVITHCTSVINIKFCFTRSSGSMAQCYIYYKLLHFVIISLTTHWQYVLWDNPVLYIITTILHPLTVSAMGQPFKHPNKWSSCVDNTTWCHKKKPPWF